MQRKEGAYLQASTFTVDFRPPAFAFPFQTLSLGIFFFSSRRKEKKHKEKKKP